MLLAAGASTTLGGPTPRLAFREEPKAPGTWAGRRLLFLDEEPAFELSFWCGTCPLLFERLEGANDSLSLGEMQETLAAGLDALDGDVLQRFGELLEEGEYVPLLLSIEPRLVLPVQPGDYFADEQVDTWGVDSFWGLPHYPHTAYYRTFETAVSADAHLYEFVVPMLSPAWNDRLRVDEHAEALARSSTPTAVAVSILDVCAPAVDSQSTDYYEHWGLTHFLLDGHHKVHAAAETGRQLRLLSLLSVDGSLAERGQVLRIPRIRANEPIARGRAPKRI